MATGAYAVSGDAVTTTRDVSYRSCLCALLIFIAICLIILLAGIRWKKDDVEDDKGSVDRFKGGKYETTESNTILPIINTSTTSTVTRRLTTTTTEAPTKASTETVTKATTKAPIEAVTEAITEVVTEATTKAPIEAVTEAITRAITEVVTEATTKVPIEAVTEAITRAVTEVVTEVVTEAVTEAATKAATEVTTEVTTKTPSTTSTTKSTSTTETNDNEIVLITTRSTTEASTTTEKLETTTESEDNLLLKILLTTYETTAAITSEATVEPFKNDSQSTLSSIPDEGETPNSTETISKEATSTEDSTTPVLIGLRINENDTTMTIISTTESDYNYETLEVVEATNTDDVTDYPTTEIMESQPPNTTVLQTTTATMTSTLTTLTTLKEFSTESVTKIPETIEVEPVCLTAGCKSTSSRILSLMNHATDPCEDFYEFACGGMQADNSNVDALNRISEQLYLIDHGSLPYLGTYKTFYDSCVSHEHQFDYNDRIVEVLKLVKEVGKIYDNEQQSDGIDMTLLFANLILRESLPILDIDVDINRESSNFVFKLTLPRKVSILAESGHRSALTDSQKRCLDKQRHELQKQDLNLNKIHESFLNCQKDYTIYLNSIETAVRTFGLYSHWNNTYNQTQVIQDLRTTIEWDILEHMNILPPPTSIRKTILFKDYTVLRIADLKLQYSFLEWDKLFKIISKRQFDDNTFIQVYFPQYFSALFDALNNIPEWKINNALIAMYSSILYENLIVPQAKNDRESYCIKLSTILFRDVSSNLYARTWTETDMEESQKFLKKTFVTLKKNLINSTESADWLDDASKISLLHKVEKMKLTFNKKDDIYNEDSYLNLKYKNIALLGNTFINNTIKMMIFNRHALYDLVPKQYTINYLWNYFVSIYDDKPMSFYSEGLIMAPLGIIKQPVKGFPGYVTMARIGLSLAREIGRHFDPVGIQYGMTLSPESKPSYNFLRSIMENESLFKVTKLVGQQRVTFSADPTLSTNIRIADNTGVKLLTDDFPSFKQELLLPWINTSYTREQIFFIAVAQEYCKKTDITNYMLELFETENLPSSLQVENIVTNSHEFATAFVCPEGSIMNHNPLKSQFPILHEVEN